MRVITLASAGRHIPIIPDVSVSDEAAASPVNIGSPSKLLKTGTIISCGTNASR